MNSNGMGGDSERPAEPPVTTPRQRAKAARRTRYLGKPCAKGHAGERFVSNKRCCACVRENSLRWQSENRARLNLQARTRRPDCAVPPTPTASSR